MQRCRPIPCISYNSSANIIISLRPFGTARFLRTYQALLRPRRCVQASLSTTTNKAFGYIVRQLSCSNNKGMRIATLQFAPRLGDVEGNIKRANRLLKLVPGDDDSVLQEEEPGIEELRPDILVLPEMAFSGENFCLIFCVLTK